MTKKRDKLTAFARRSGERWETLALAGGAVALSTVAAFGHGVSFINSRGDVGKSLTRGTGT